MIVNTELLERIKLRTISAFVSDDTLLGILVLKGGNALGLAYDITNRGSIDIDFSMENDFTEAELKRLRNQMSSLLNEEFNKESLVTFDVKITEKPKNLKEEVKSFWGGYLLEFKVATIEKFELNKENGEKLSREAIPLHEDGSTKFTVDISKYEYVTGKVPKDIQGATVFVYSPEMLALEKLRALCQQNPGYRDVVLSMTSKSRARDFYDIYNLVRTFSLDFTTKENVELCKHIFEAKKVPLEFIGMLAEQKEFHRQSWSSVEDTVNPNEVLKPYDFYFDLVIDLFKHLT